MELWIFFTILIVMFLAYVASKLLSLRKKRATQKALAREKRKERTYTTETYWVEDDSFTF